MINNLQSSLQKSKIIYLLISTLTAQLAQLLRHPLRHFFYYYRYRVPSGCPVRIGSNLNSNFFIYFNYYSNLEFKNFQERTYSLKMVQSTMRKIFLTLLFLWASLTNTMMYGITIVSAEPADQPGGGKDCCRPGGGMSH